MTNLVQDEINKIVKSKLPVDEYINYLNGNNILIKANSIMAIVHHEVIDAVIISKLAEIGDRMDKESRVMGIYSNSHFAIAALYWLNTEKSINEYNKIVATLNDDTKKDIDNLLLKKSEFNWFE